MGFRGEAFAFDSPAGAVAAMVARARSGAAHRPTQAVALGASVGRILAADALADRESPAFDHASMDGYAVRAADVVAAARAGAPAITIPVVGESRIGREPPGMPDGIAAVRIATGAPIPAGIAGRCVVLRREDVVEHAGATGGEVGAITVDAGVCARVREGDAVRVRGENARAGAVVVRAGEVVSGAAIGALAAVGVVRPVVFMPLRIAVITTGDEVVAPHVVPSPFQIRDANGPAVRAILASHPWAHVALAVHARDDGSMVGALDRAMRDADAIVITGGVSMGHRDHVRAVVEAIGGEIVFHGLPQRPGKPMLGAVAHRHGASAGPPVPILALPGNPVSAMVTCVRIVAPVLAAWAGAERTPPACLPRMVDWAPADGRTLDLWWHRLVRVGEAESGRVRAEPVDARGSGDIVAAGMSDGFVEVPPGVSPAVVPCYLWPAGAGHSANNAE